MKILFLKNVPRQGIAGEVKEVADGFASFLLKSGSVVVATPQVIEQNKKKIEEAAMRAKGEESFMKDLAKKLDGFKLVIKGNSNPKGNLYKSFHAKDIAEALTKEIVVGVNEENLEDVTIKNKGLHDVGFVYKGKKLATVSVEII